MFVIRFAARNFRNLEEEEIFPCEEVNVIYGNNAQGKTNLLEGMWLFTGGHSFRGAKDAELPRIDPDTGKNMSGTALCSRSSLKKSIASAVPDRKSVV